MRKWSDDEILEKANGPNYQTETFKNMEPLPTMIERGTASDSLAFVFIDGRGNPYKVAPQRNQTWLFYWNKGPKSWVTLGEIRCEEELEAMRELSLPPEQAKLYD